MSAKWMDSSTSVISTGTKSSLTAAGLYPRQFWQDNRALQKMSLLQDSIFQVPTILRLICDNLYSDEVTPCILTCRKWHDWFMPLLYEDIFDLDIDSYEDWLTVPGRLAAVLRNIHHTRQMFLNDARILPFLQSSRCVNLTTLHILQRLPAVPMLPVNALLTIIERNPNLTELLLQDFPVNYEEKFKRLILAIIGLKHLKRLKVYCQPATWAPIESLLVNLPISVEEFRWTQKSGFLLNRVSRELQEEEDHTLDMEEPEDSTDEDGEEQNTYPDHYEDPDDHRDQDMYRYADPELHDEDDSLNFIGPLSGIQPSGGPKCSLRTLAVDMPVRYLGGSTCLPSMFSDWPELRHIDLPRIDPVTLRAVILPLRRGCPLLESIKIRQPIQELEDEDPSSFDSLLGAVAVLRKLVIAQDNGFFIQPQYTVSLLKHGSTLTHLDLLDVLFTSEDMQSILVDCRHLVRCVFSVTRILGAHEDRPPALLRLEHASSTPWTCTGLKVLRLDFSDECGQRKVDEAQMALELRMTEALRYQFAQLTQLENLEVAMYHEEDCSEGDRNESSAVKFPYDSEPSPTEITSSAVEFGLSLLSGLDVLASLTHMRRLRIAGQDPEWGEPELEWVQIHWKDMETSL